MDECSARPISTVGFHQRRSSITMRDTIENRINIQNCNQSGCTHNSREGIVIDNQERLKFSRRTFYSGKKIMVDHSCMPSSSANMEKTWEQWWLVSPDETVVESNGKWEQTNEVGSSSRENLNLGSISAATGLLALPVGLENLESVMLNDHPPHAGRVSGSSTVIAHRNPGKQITHVCETSHLNPHMFRTSSYQNSDTSRNNFHLVNSQGQSANSERFSVRNLSYVSMPDIILSSGCSSSYSTYNRTDALKRRCPDGDRASTSKGSAECSNSRNLDSLRTTPVPSLSEYPMPRHIFRRTRNQYTCKDVAVSVRTRRTSNRDIRNVSEQRDVNTVSVHETLSIPGETNSQSSVREDSIREMPWASHVEVTSTQPSSSINNGYTGFHLEDGQISHGSLAGGRYQRFSMDAIKEALSALERTDQVEHLTYEQRFVLETNLFLGRLQACDQHRDMRLDIDNMSYEELLDLEEKMGNVSTGLTEEAISKCLNKHIHMPTSSSLWTASCDDDIKCSICQEEYGYGDEVGKLYCEHAYHVACVRQWLRLKNWCPICKASALPQQT